MKVVKSSIVMITRMCCLLTTKCELTISMPLSRLPGKCNSIDVEANRKGSGGFYISEKSVLKIHNFQFYTLVML